MGWSKEEFNSIHKNLEVIVNLVNENVTGRKPKCVSYIEKMYHNVGICIAYNYKDMGEVRRLVKADWKIANDKHNGINQYSFEKDDKKEENRINQQLEIAVMTLDSLING